MPSTMRTILISFICFIVDVIDGQVHIIPLTSAAHCYQCDGHHPFPGCLNSPAFCAADEVCAITYASGDPIIRCMKLHDCQNDLGHVTGLCDGGGYEIRPGVCQRCCDTPDCLAQVTNVLSNEYNRDIFCPGQCSSLDLAACIHSQIQCTHGQFCEVTVDDHHTVHGACKAVHDLQKCNDDKNKHPCSSALLSGGHGPRCVWDCCTSLDCLNAHFGVFQEINLCTMSVSVCMYEATNHKGCVLKGQCKISTALPTSQHIVVTTAAPVPIITSGYNPAVRCLSCIGSECHTSTTLVQCAGGFCKHTVSHLNDNQIFQEKGCATREECHLLWTSEDDNIKQECLFALEPKHIVHSPLICHYCCTGHSLAQVHVLPMTDPLAPLTCYHCDEHVHSFPECLSTPVTCHADEVCSIAYSSEKTNIKCQKVSECSSLASRAAGPCAEGVFLLNSSQCLTCCNTSTCVGDLLSKNISVQNQDIFCPGQCSSLDLAACIHSQTRCTHGQFCEVTVDDHHTIKGACKAAHELQKCNDDQNKHPCSSTFLNGGHGTKCVWDCCTTLDCLNAHFGAFLAIPTTSNVAVTTAAPVQITSSVRCLSCIGSECLTSSPIAQCTGGLCRHIVNHLSTGQTFQEKGCATREECHLLWTSEDAIIKQECIFALDHNHSVHVPLNCHYCCSGDFCNVANITFSNLFNV